VSNDPYRLPADVIPSHYKLYLAPDVEEGTFSGHVVINADVVGATSEIVCNNDGLNIASVTVNSAECTWTLDTELERMTIVDPDGFSPGPVEIEIHFDGLFNEKLVGFYRSSFTDDDGNEHFLATTQFEATHARKAFPCWDEPSAKATYEISLRAPAGMNAISNASETSRNKDPDCSGAEIIDFAPTMKMSTYLVAIVIGPLEFSKTIDVDGIPVRIVHVPGKGHLTDFALDCAAFALRYFSEYFALPYPGDKCDLVAIPDFAFGAMENLGCITFREVLLLVDPTTATQPELQRSADVINHELAHMWFGDLVTMVWWNGLWLNEAFATFMEMRCTDAYRPEWKRWVDFGLSRTAAFDTDALASTRPIEFKVTSPDEAEGMFDILTYEKGAAVVRMLEQYLGDDEFRSGIRRYMADNAYANAETTDLWDAIEAETGQPVRAIMDSWIFQGGFPLVSAKISADGSEVTLHQERFGYAGGDSAPAQEWKTPVMFREQPDGHEPATERNSVLIEPGAPVTIPLSGSGLFVPNAEGASFIRVAYDPDHLDALAGAGSALGAVERYGLVDDAWAGVLADTMSTPAFLNLLEAMSTETDRSVWQRIISGFASLDHLLGGDARESLTQISHDAFSPALVTLGLAPEPDDDDRTKQLRGDLIAAMGKIANNHEVQEECQRTVSVGRRNPELVDPALMAAAVSVTASIGDEADFADFVGEWRSAATPQEEMRYLHALADFPDPEQASQLRQMILDGDVRSQNAASVLARSVQNRENGRETWTFITENWSYLNDFLASSAIPRMVAAVTSLDYPSDAVQVGEFFAANPLPQAEQTLAQILERQRVRVALRQREADRLAIAVDRHSE
jgi:puromycin-sensitive aminopeptidase